MLSFSYNKKWAEKGAIFITRDITREACTRRSCTFMVAEMAWVLVLWKEEDKHSVIPSDWVVEPNPVPTVLPVDGRCYWRKKTAAWDTRIIASSGIAYYSPLIFLYTLSVMLQTQRMSYNKKCLRRQQSRPQS